MKTLTVHTIADGYLAAAAEGSHSHPSGRCRVSMRTLKTSALESCLHRGHDMGRFRSYGPYNAVAECRVCGMDVQCLTRPQPNQIDVAGAAVALECVGMVA